MVIGLFVSDLVNEVEEELYGGCEKEGEKYGRSGGGKKGRLHEKKEEREVGRSKKEKGKEMKEEACKEGRSRRGKEVKAET